jgi:hypothetical protein
MPENNRDAQTEATKPDKHMSPGVTPGKIDIGKHAIVRMKDGTAHGKDPNPWLDTSRNFAEEAMEKAADGFNYTGWGLLQKSAPVEALSNFLLAQIYFEHAYTQLQQAKEIMERNGGGYGEEEFGDNNPKLARGGSDARQDQRPSHQANCCEDKGGRKYPDNPVRQKEHLRPGGQGDQGDGNGPGIILQSEHGGLETPEIKGDGIRPDGFSKRTEVQLAQKGKYLDRKAETTETHGIRQGRGEGGQAVNHAPPHEAPIKGPRRDKESN